MNTQMSIIISRVNEDRENEAIIKIKNYIKEKQDYIKYCGEQIKMYENEIVETQSELTEVLDMSIEEASKLIEDSIQIVMLPYLSSYDAANKLLNR